MLKNLEKVFNNILFDKIVKVFPILFTCNIDQFDRAKTHRMPWRDEALVIFGDSARDLARHFIQRWNQCKVIGFILKLIILAMIHRDFLYFKREKK